MTAQELYEKFAVARDPRSPEYKQGVLDILKHRLGETQQTPRTVYYQTGTAQADAYWAGCDEGHRLATAHLDAVRDGMAAIWQSN